MSTMIQQTLEKLHHLRLHGMADSLSEQLASPASRDLSFEDRFALLVDAEITHKENARLKRLLKGARLRESACLEDLDYRPGRGIDRSKIASLALLDWIHQGLNMVITGATGSGKTWLACALGNQACRKGMRVIYQRIPLLLEELAIAHGDGSFRKRLSALAKVDLLILDDFGLAPLGANARSDLMELVEQRSGLKATLITSQIPVGDWHTYLSGGNPTVADAILDRLLSAALRMELHGESMRRIRASEILSSAP